MISTRAIKRNKKLEKYFLGYLKCSYLLQTVPKDPHQNISPVETAKYLDIFNEFNSALNALLHQLDEHYNLRVQRENCDDPVNQIIIEVCEYYEKKYGEETIFKMTNTKENKTIKPNKLLMQQMLRVQSNNCENCGDPRIEVPFEQLPKDAKKAFEYGLDQADSFLYCAKCKAIQ
jgi:hypothetical protein